MANIFRSKKDRKKTSKADPRKLRFFNFLTAGLYLLQSALIVILSDPDKSSQPVTTGYITSDRAGSLVTNQPTMSQANHLLFDLNISYLIAALLLIAGLTHLLLATRHRASYETDLKNRVNKARWLGYSITLGILVTVVAMLSGLLDLAGLIMLFSLTAILGLFVLHLENRSLTKPNSWLTHAETIKLSLLPLLVLLIYAWGAYAYGGGLPAFMYFIYLSLLLLFATLAINLYLQMKKIGHWENYLFSEKVFMIVSFLATSAIAWQIFFGTLR